MKILLIFSRAQHEKLHFFGVKTGEGEKYEKFSLPSSESREGGGGKELNKERSKRASNVISR